MTISSCICDEHPSGESSYVSIRQRNRYARISKHFLSHNNTHNHVNNQYKYSDFSLVIRLLFLCVLPFVIPLFTLQNMSDCAIHALSTSESET